MKKDCDTCRHIDASVSYLPCCACRGFDKWEQPTNADHIRSMTDDELGSVLFGALGSVICPNGCDNCDGDCDKHALDWLKQPYKEDT